MNGTPVSELRRQSRDDALMRAQRSQVNPVIWHTRDGKGRPGWVRRPVDSLTPDDVDEAAFELAAERGMDRPACRT